MGHMAVDSGEPEGGRVTCPACEGTGYVNRLHYLGPDQPFCTCCKGDGEVDEDFIADEPADRSDDGDYKYDAWRDRHL